MCAEVTSPRRLAHPLESACNSILAVLLVTHVLFLRTLKSSAEATQANGGTATPHYLS